MSQWAREHPELCEEGVTAYDWYAERADLLRQERKDNPCEECGGTGRAPTGECREAMSGPTCRNSACPPCQTPEVGPCFGCEGSGTA